MTCTSRTPISQKESLADPNPRCRVGRCRARRGDWVHSKTVGVPHCRRAIEKGRVVDVTRHRICGAKIANHVEQRGALVVERRATSRDPSLGRIIWLRQIKASQFGEADKRPGILQRQFASLSWWSEPQGGLSKGGTVIRRFTILGSFRMDRGTSHHCSVLVAASVLLPAPRMQMLRPIGVSFENSLAGWLPGTLGTRFADRLYWRVKGVLADDGPLRALLLLSATTHHD
jgi:hypothetical protein